MKTKILIATTNSWKFQEILDVVWDLPFNFISLNDLKIEDDVEENWKTYEENAKIKAEFFWKISWFPIIADDSWIKVEALEWELWVKTRRRWAWKNASDEEWMDFFLKRMEREKNRKAEFFTSIAFFDWEKTLNFKGSCSWVILKKQDWPLIPWIPLSSYFVPNWYKIAYSNLWNEEKNKISHRWKACLELKKYFQKNPIVKKEKLK